MSIEINLSLSYHESDGSSLNFHFDFNLPGQGITVVTGPSGAGKTTLLRCVAGLIRGHGTLSVNDQKWQTEDTFMPTYRRPLGYVFQEASLFPHLTVRKNLEYGSRRQIKRGGRPFMDLDHFIEILGLKNLLKRRPDTLSGGERQRTALARALASGPELLLLDEPLAALDQGRKDEIMPYLESLKELTIPIIYVSHDQQEIERLADTRIGLVRPVPA